MRHFDCELFDFPHFGSFVCPKHRPGFGPFKGRWHAFKHGFGDFGRPHCPTDFGHGRHGGHMHGHRMPDHRRNTVEERGESRPRDGPQNSQDETDNEAQRSDGEQNEGRCELHQCHGHRGHHGHHGHRHGKHHGRRSPHGHYKPYPDPREMRPQHGPDFDSGLQGPPRFGPHDHHGCFGPHRHYSGSFGPHRHHSGSFGPHIHRHGSFGPHIHRLGSFGPHERHWEKLDCSEYRIKPINCCTSDESNDEPCCRRNKAQNPEKSGNGKRCEGKKKSGTDTERNRDQNEGVTETVLIQKIVVERVPRPKSV